jgi:hypothetical protein
MTNGLAILAGYAILGAFLVVLAALLLGRAPEHDDDA